MYVYVCECLRLWMFTFVDVYVCGCLRLWMFTFVDVYVYGSFTFVDVYVYGDVYVYECLDSCMCRFIHV